MAEETGEVADAFLHPVHGPIAFVYGTDAYGLQHIKREHGETALRALPGILRDGTVESLGSRLRFTSLDGKSIAIVPMDWRGQPKTWVLTSYNTSEVEEARRRGGRLLPGRVGRLTRPLKPLRRLPKRPGSGKIAPIASPIKARPASPPVPRPASAGP